MECRSHGLSLPHRNRIIAVGGDHLDFRTDALNLRRSDEDHFGRRSQEFSFTDRAVNLASISIAADTNVERAQSGLRGIVHLAGEQDRSSARAKCRLQADELFQLLESGFAQQFEKRARFASRDDQAVDLTELLRFLDEHNLCAQLFEPAAMSIEIALQR